MNLRSALPYPKEEMFPIIIMIVVNRKKIPASLAEKFLEITIVTIKELNAPNILIKKTNKVLFKNSFLFISNNYIGGLSLFFSFSSCIDRL